MAVQNPYLAGDILGDLNQAKKKREGISAMPDPLGVQGRARQAMRPQQTIASPMRPVPQGVAKPVAQNTPAAAAQQEPGLMDGVAGGAKVIVGGIAEPFAQGIDAARSGLARVSGGDPETLPGGRTKYADAAAATRQQGIAQVSGAGEAIRGDVRDALGVKPAQSIAAPVVPVGATTQQVGQQSASARSPAAEYVGTGIGAGAQGGEIAARRGTNGVMEFTNEAATPGAVSKAGALPAGGVGSIGNGIGTFSVGEDGDSKLAMERFERANAISANTVKESRRGGIGEGGGRVTVVADSSRAPSIAEIVRGRQENDQAQTDALRAQTEQGIAAGSQQLLTGQLQQQKLQQDLTVGQFGLEGQKRAAEIQAQLADPNLDPALRPQLEAAYYALNTPAKDRYMTVTGGTNELGGKDASRVFDRRTGQYVDVQGAQPSLESDQNALAIKNDTSLSREQKVAALKKLGYN